MIPRRPARAERPSTRLGMAAFWASSLSVGLAAFVVLAVLAHTGAPGELADASAIISVSFVLAVVPGAIQLRAAAHAATPDGAPGLPAPFVAWTTGGLLLLAAPLAQALTVPAPSLGMLALQYAAACIASAQRGIAIGRSDHREASRSMGVEAIVRVVAGIGLGQAFGPTGLAAALLLGSVAAALIGRSRAGSLTRTAAREVFGPALTVGLLMLLVNLDAFAAPRVLGASAADAYAMAELPARGTFFALFAVSWLAVPLATRAARPSELLTPIAGVLGLGAGVGLSLLIVRPLLPIALGDPAPAATLLATLVAAMVIAAALATALAMAVARNAPVAWAPTLVAAASLAAGIAAGPSSAEALGALLLLATTAALIVTVGVLLRTATPRAAQPARPPALARR